MLELGMLARAIQRWRLGALLGALCLVVGAASPGRAARPGVSPPPAAPAPAVQVLIAPFGAPAAMPALGEELARALFAALREANIPARLGKSERGEEGSTISGRLEEISQTQVRLHASYRGHGVQSVGDLEHLDDLVYAVFTQLRPRLQPLSESGDGRSGSLTQPDSSPAGPPATPVAPSAPPEALAVLGPKTSTTDSSHAVVEAALTTTTPPGASARAAADREPDKSANRHAEKSTAKDPAAAHDKQAAHAARGKDPGSKDAGSHPERASLSGHRSDSYALVIPGKSSPAPSESPAQTSKEAATPVTPAAPVTTPPVATTAPPSPVPPDPSGTVNPPVPSPRPAPAPFAFDPRRPRVAVHVVGEPILRVPPGFYGLGTVGQQTLVSYLQQRWRVPALGSRLVGLTGGLQALDQSLRLGARHTLMARLDSLTLTSSPVVSTGLGSAPVSAGGTLSGRLHVVLLLDGKLLLDRSIMMPPTLVLAGETPAQAYSRALYAALDSVAGELYARLTQPPPG